MLRLLSPAPCLGRQLQDACCEAGRPACTHIDTWTHSCVDIACAASVERPMYCQVVQWRTYHVAWLCDQAACLMLLQAQVVYVSKQRPERTLSAIASIIAVECEVRPLDAPALVQGCYTIIFLDIMGHCSVQLENYWTWSLCPCWHAMLISM